MLDTWHYFRGTTDDELLAAILGDRIGAVQASDAAREPCGDLVNDCLHHRLPAGDGAFPLDRVLHVLESTGGLHQVGPEIFSAAFRSTAGGARRTARNAGPGAMGGRNSTTSKRGVRGREPVIITSRSDVEAAGAVELMGSALRYPLVGTDLGGSARGQVNLLVLPPGSTHILAADGFEEAAVVVWGEAELPGGKAPAGTVVHCRPGQAVTLHASETQEVTLLHLRSAAAPQPAEDVVAGGMVATFDVGEVAETPAHNPELGFFHMQARMLVDGPSGGRRTFTLGMGTFAPAEGCHALHRHAHADEAFFIWNGQGAHLTEDGAGHPMAAGQLVWAARNEWHGFRNTGTVPLRAFFCYLGVDDRSSAGYEVMHPQARNMRTSSA